MRAVMVMTMMMISGDNLSHTVDDGHNDYDNLIDGGNDLNGGDDAL